MKKPVVSKIITGLFIANLYMISIQISFDKNTNNMVLFTIARYNIVIPKILYSPKQYWIYLMIFPFFSTNKMDVLLFGG